MFLPQCKKLRVVIYLLLGVAVLLLYAAWHFSSGDGRVKGMPHKSLYQVGILMSDDLPEQNHTKDGVIAGMTARGYKAGTNIRFETLSGGGTEEGLKTAAAKMAAKKEDLIITIGHDASEAMLKVTDKTPVVGAGVIITTEDSPFEKHGNFTGTCEVLSLDKQLETAGAIIPLHTLGIMYDPKDESSVAQLKQLRLAAARRGIYLYEVALAKTQAPHEVAAGLSGHVDALYTPQEDAIESDYAAVIDTANKIHIPVIGANDQQVDKGALVSLSPDYYRMGFKSGFMAASILSGKKLVSDIKPELQKEPSLVINMKEVRLFHRKLPSAIWQRARKLYLYDGQPARP